MALDAAYRIRELEADLAREQGKLRALQDIGQALGSTLHLDDLLDLLLTRVARILDADRSTLFLIDDVTGEFFSKVTHAGQTFEVRLERGQGLAGWSAQTGRTLNVKDAYQDVRFNAEWDRRTGYRSGSTLCVPVRNHHGRIIGVLQALNKRSGYFSLDDEAMGVALAAQAAVSIENSKLFLSVVGKNMELLETKEKLERKVRELDVLFEIAQVSVGAVKLDELLDGVLARAMHAIDAEAGSILLEDESTGDLRFRCAVGGDPTAVKHLKIPAGSGICGWVAANRQPQVVNDVTLDARHSQAIADEVGYRPRSVLCVPLMLGERGGALELLNKAQGRTGFTDDDLKLASVIAGHVSTAIRLGRARERREQQERLSAIGQLLSSVVHDLRGPLTVITGYARFLGDEEDADERTRLVQKIQRQIEIINAMTGEILAFARGDTKVLVHKVYLGEFFEELLQQLKLQLDGRGLEVTLHLHDRGVAWIDRQKIQRAVHNLARNAAQAMQGRRGHFVVEVDRATNGDLLLRFSDDGPGIADSIRERIFESFTTHGNPEGTGLGLAIVRKVVDDHGGTVEVNSQPGETVFTIRLPQPEAVEVARDHQPAVPALVGGKPI